jgi:hypothetical protein
VTVYNVTITLEQFEAERLVDLAQEALDDRLQNYIKPGHAFQDYGEPGEYFAYLRSFVLQRRAWRKAFDQVYGE